MPKNPGIGMIPQGDIRARPGVLWLAPTSDSEQLRLRNRVRRSPHLPWTAAACGVVFAARCPLPVADAAVDGVRVPRLRYRVCVRSAALRPPSSELPRGSLRLLTRPLRFTAVSTELWTLPQQAYLDRIRPITPCPPPGGEMTSFAVIGLSAMIELARTAQRPGAVPPSAEGVAAFRSNLPGPSRRIVVEPIKVPAQPVQVPTEAPAEPARRPQGEPVPAR